jgi:hypothetical protein
MSKYIKFSNGIINTAFIRCVDINKPAKQFIIHLNSSHNTGLGFGYFRNEYNQILVSEAKHPEGYASVEKWIKSINCVSNDQST